MKILLIGASGCFGTELRNIISKKNKVKLIYYSSAKLNILDYKNLNKKIKSIRPGVIINSSAIVGINQCEVDYNEAFSVNTIGALNLAKICAKLNIILVQTSTHAVFDGKQTRSYNENDIPKPNNVYSGTKYLAEVYVASICKSYYILRFPTLYGQRNNKLKGFVDKVIDALKLDETLKIAADKIDSPTYARDAADALFLILENKKKFGIYHLANEGKVSYLKFVEEIKKILKSNSKIISVKDVSFQSLGFKPLKTSLKSKKIKLRNWKIALSDYIKTIK
jgi:dTDP-4-dehydrorhamnose reductase